MARISPYVLRFVLMSMLLPVLLALVGWFYYDDVKAKSFYYRLISSNLMTHLDGGELSWVDDSLSLQLATRDSLITCASFNAKNFNKARFDFHRLDGSTIALDVPFDSLSPYMKRVMRKIPELDLREMHSPEPGHLQFRLGATSWLHYTAMAEDEPQGMGSYKRLDDNWYVLEEAP